jgi:two-component system nitrogen regulation sensor histidine kinase GlnL
MDKGNILESLTTAVIIATKDLKIVYANTATEQVCGISRKKLKNLFFCDLIDRSEIKVITAIKSLNFTSSFPGFSAADVLISPLPGKSSKADLTIFPYIENAFDGIIVEIHPIANQEKIISQMQQNNQYSVARDLIRNLAHEIKNPLGGIRGAAQLLEMSYKDKIEDLLDYTKVIIEQTDRLKILVNNLLGPQRPNPMVNTNIHYLIEKSIKLAKMQEDSQNITVVKDYDPSLPELPLDADSIEQVMINIVHNAVEALQTSNTPSPYIRIKTRAAISGIIREKRYPLVLIITISNNGPEIPQKIKDTVFFPMVTTKFNGNGLGLSLALNIVERHGGTIECISDKHETSFRIILPLKRNTEI